jgi:hypothetical protein
MWLHHLWEISRSKYQRNYLDGAGEILFLFFTVLHIVGVTVGYIRLNNKNQNLSSD